MKEKVLLIGNGIYRAFHEEESWDNVLNYVWRRFCEDGVSVEMCPIEVESKILYFDYLYARWKSHALQNELDLWRDFFERLKSYFKEWFSRNEHAESISSINDMVWSHFNVVLTTNIDTRLERICDTGWKTSSEGKWKYSTYRRKTNGARTIFYLHGSVDSENSICFGLDHYLGECRSQYEYLFEGKTEHKNPILDLLHGNMRDESELDRNSWLYHLLFSDVDIVGQGLDRSEVDLWWALEKRFQYRNIRKNQKKFEESKENKIRFFMPCSDFLKNRWKVEMLKSLDIEIVKIHCDRYEDFYRQYFEKYAGANFIDVKG